MNKRLPKSERVDVVNIWNHGIVLNVKEVLFNARVLVLIVFRQIDLLGGR